MPLNFVYYVILLHKYLFVDKEINFLKRKRTKLYFLVLDMWAVITIHQGTINKRNVRAKKLYLVDMVAAWNHTLMSQIPILSVLNQYLEGILPKLV